MYGRAKSINILPYLDYLMFLIAGYNACSILARIIEEDMRLAGLSINRDRSDNETRYERSHLGFLVYLAEGIFKVPTTR
jgi:hypothetical protein